MYDKICIIFFCVCAFQSRQIVCALVVGISAGIIVMVTFQKRDVGNVCSRQMQPTKGAAKKMKHSVQYKVTESVRFIQYR